MSSSEESPQALSDPLPRIYLCFCEKVFTTYPGIYLHLKSKHGNLFQKYKKLKITKLFKKGKDEKGSEVYRLDKLSEKEATNNYFIQKKIKQNKKRNKADGHENIAVIEDDEPRDDRRKMLNFTQPPTFQNQQPNANFLPRFGHENPKDMLERMGNNPYYSSFPFPNPYFSYPYPQPPCFPPYQHFPFPPPPYFKSESTIKRLMHGFLSRSETRNISNRIILKDALYDLMIFIDTNCASLPDPRIRQRIFLSYCDQCQPKFITNLLNDYVTRKQEALEAAGPEEKEGKMKELDYIVNFTQWLKGMGLLGKHTSNKDGHQTQPLSIQRQALSSSENMKKGEIFAEYQSEE